MISIKEAFAEDHEIINQMLNELIQTNRTSNGNLMQEFNDLRNAINKHIKEEEEIHQTLLLENVEFEDVIKSTKEQHKQITTILDDMCDYEEFELEEYEHRINTLINITKNHHSFEEEYLYSKVDDILDEKEKARVIYELESRIKKTE